VRSFAGCTLRTCTTREMKDELITYILNETVVHYSVGARGHNTHENDTRVLTGGDFQQAETVLCNNIT